MIARTLLLATAALAVATTPAIARKKRAMVGPTVAEANAATTGTPAVSVVVDSDTAHDPDNVLYLDLSDGGRVAIRLMPQWAPQHVERIKTLTRQGFYNGVIFHRVIEGFMAQTGDPTGTGQGGSKLPNLKAEFNAMPHLRGMVSMARTDDPDTANSQFFIVFYPRFALDHKYTVFGRVIGGMQWVDKVARGEPPANPTKVLQASLGSENKPMAAMPPPAAAPTLGTSPAVGADQGASPSPS